MKQYLYRLSIFGFFLFDFWYLFIVGVVVGGMMDGVDIMFSSCLGTEYNFV